MKKNQATLTLHLLGKVQLRHDEHSLVDDLAGKEQALLIYLACQSRQRFSREHLATLFWGEIPQSRSRYNLRRALWQLRNALEEAGLPPDDCITADSSWIRLTPDAPCWVDALEFENVLKTYFRGTESRFSSMGKDIHQIRQTLDLYRGDFLEGFSILHAPDFEEWVTIERERLFLLLLRALTNLIQEFIGQGQHSEAITTCHRILALDPLQEDIHRLLMRLYWETGQRAQAIRQYQTYQELLQRELGIQPLEETQALYQRILQQKTPPTAPSSSLVLTSRLTPPTPPPEAFFRSRLINLLDRGLDTRLTLLSAPPGYGKTTLVSQWLQTHTHNGDPSDIHFTWYKVGPVDNDPAVFLEGLAASIARIHSDVNPTLQNEIRDIVALQGDIRQAVGHLLNALASLDTHPLVIILDDEERLTNPESLRVLQHIIDFLPANGHLYVLTRTDPSLPLPRLRIRGQLLELRTPELRFTSEEAHTFLQQTTGANLPPSDIEVIVSRAEGWAAPLWLAANAFKRFASNLNTVWEGVSAYLRDEVLAHQPPEVRTFLLQSAVLDRLTPELCHAVLNLPDVEDPRQAAQWLNEIEKRNLFIQRLHSSGPNVFTAPTNAKQAPQYTYHPLFRSFLRSELVLQHTPAEIKALHRRAAQTLEDRGELQSALVHYQQAGDEDDVARLLDQGLVQAPPRWLEQISSTPSDRHPQITLSAGRLHQAEGRLDEARQFYQQAAQGFEARDDQLNLGDSLLALAEVSLLGGRYAQGLEMAQRAMAKWEMVAADADAAATAVEKSVDIVQRHTATLCTIGQLQACQGYLAEAQATLKKAQQILVELTPPTLTFQVLRTQAWVAYLQGAYHRAMALNQLAEQEAGRDVPPEIVAAFRNPIPAILREWGEGDIVQQVTRRRVLAARQGKDRLALVHALVDLGNLHLDRGQYDEAAEAFQQALDEAEAFGADDVYLLYALAHIAYFHFLQGSHQEIERVVSELDRYEDQESSLLASALIQLIATLPAVHERLSGADSPNPQLYQQLADVHDKWDQLGVSYGAFVSAALLGALHLAEHADESPPPQARRYISTALALAAAEGYIQALVVSADLSLPLLRFGLREGIEPHFVSRVLARIGSKALPVILDLVETAAPLVRERAITALKTFRAWPRNHIHQDTILTALYSLDQDDAPRVRAAASQARQKPSS